MLGVGIGLGVGEFIARRPGLAPKLDLNFASTRSLTASKGPTPSFSRASTGTFFNSSGVLTSAAINAPRFNHTFNGTSWVSRGLLVEDQRTNVAIYSNTFSNAAWEKYDSSISSSGTGPDGSTASLLTENTANGAHWLRQQTSTSVASGAGVSVTASIFVKANGRSVVGFGFDNSFAFVGKSVRGRFDLSDGSFANEYNCDSYSITNVGNGWYRLSVTSTAIQAGLARFDFFLYTSDTSGGITYTGDGSSGVFLFGAQVEQGAFPTSYIGTTSASTTRSADVCQIIGSDFSGFWNGTEGTIVVEYDTYVPSSNTTYNSRVVAVSDVATNLHRVFISPNASAIPNGQSFEIRHEPSGQYSVLAKNPFIGSGTPVKIAGAYKVDDISASFNGAAILSDTSQAVPTGCDIMRLGNNPASENYLCGHIARLRYFNKRLPNATLQKLST